LDKKATHSRRKFVSNYTAQIVSSGSKLVFLFLLSVFVTRYWGAEAYGEYTSLVAYVMLFRFAIDWGLSRLITREVSRYQDRVSEYVSASLQVICVTATLAVAAMFVIDHFINISGGDARVLFLAALWQILTVVGLFFSGVFFAFERMFYDTITVLVGFAVGLVFMVILLPNSEPDLAILLFFLVIAQLVNVLSSAVVYLIKLGRFRFHIDWSLNKALLLTTIPFGLQILLARETNFHLVYLGISQGNEVTGYFRPAEMLALFPVVFATMMGTVIYPQLSRAFKSSQANFRGLMRKSIHYMLASSFPITIGLFMLAEPILVLIYGPKFDTSAQYLKILSLSLPFTFVNNVLNTAVTSADRQGLRTAVLSITVLTHIGLSLWLIPIYGALGASVTMLLVTLLGFALYLLLIFQISGLPYRLRQSIPIIFASLVLTGFVYFASDLPLLALIPAAAAIYGLALLATDRVIRQDIRLLQPQALLSIISHRAKGVRQNPGEQTKNPNPPHSND
jgi:O-antigen/teichoic acid export membrane protein